MEVDEDCGRIVRQRRPLELSPQKERSAKMPRADVVTLAQQIADADNFVQANACNKLQIICEQMKILREQAFQVLEAAQRDRELHHTPCSFQKVPGQYYHLYEKDYGGRYLSMLSPDEWAVSNAPEQTHLGSFRLESDQSWTPAKDVVARDNRVLGLRRFVETKEVLPALLGNLIPF